MTTLAAGSSVTFSIPIGQVATVTAGSGIAILIYPLSSPIAVTGNSVIGPFPFARLVTLTATASIEYTVALPATSGGGSTGPTVPRRPAVQQVIGQGIYQANTSTAGLATALQAIGRIPMGPFPYDLKSFRVPLDGFYMATTFVQTANLKTHTVRVAIEIIGSAATVSPSVTWGGVSSKTVSPSDTLSYSDDWCVANGTIPAGTRFFVRFEVVVPSAGIMVIPQSGVPTTGPYFATTNWFTTSNGSTSPYNGVGALSVANSGGNLAQSPVIFKYFAGMFDYLKTSAFIIGNSKWTGTTADGVTDGQSGKCAISRALYDLNVPNLNLALAGTTVFQWAGLAQSAYASAVDCSDAFIGDPVNDAATRLDSLATIQANLATVIGKIRSANPSIRIWCSRGEPDVTQASFSITSLTSVGAVATATVASTATLVSGQNVTIIGAAPAAYVGTFIITVVDATTFTFPFAGGTSPATGTITFNDACTLPANQTPVAGCEQTTGVLALFNAWLPTQVGAGLNIAGFLDPCEVAEVGGSGGLARWVPIGTLDGIHPRDRMYSAESAAFKRQLSAQGFISNTGVF